MMDALIDRVIARDGIWLKTELAGQYKGKVAIGELESMCQLLVTADVVRFELELLERITNEDADRFDDKVFILAQIAYEVADELQGKHPQQVETIRQRLDELFPNERMRTVFGLSQRSSHPRPAPPCPWPRARPSTRRTRRSHPS